MLKFAGMSEALKSKLDKLNENSCWEVGRSRL